MGTCPGPPEWAVTGSLSRGRFRLEAPTRGFWRRSPTPFSPRLQAVTEAADLRRGVPPDRGRAETSAVVRVGPRHDQHLTIWSR